jgi:hypothetical protein
MIIVTIQIQDAASARNPIAFMCPETPSGAALEKRFITRAETPYVYSRKTLFLLLHSHCRHVLLHHLT